MLRSEHDHPGEYQEPVPGHDGFNYAAAVRAQRKCEVELRLVYATTNTQLKDTPTRWMTVADTPSLFSVLKTVLADKELHQSMKKHHRLQMPRDIHAVTIKVGKQPKEYETHAYDYGNWVGAGNDIDIWARFRRLLKPDAQRRRLDLPVTQININIQMQSDRTNWIPVVLQQQTELSDVPPI